MSSQNPLDLYQKILNKLNQILNTYNNLLDDQADKSSLENTFSTGGENTQPSIPLVSDVLNELTEIDANNTIVERVNTIQELLDAFNSTAQASANRTTQLISSAKSTIVKSTTVAKPVKVIPSDIYGLLYELAGMTVGAIEMWFANAEFKNLDAHLNVLVSLLDKLINILGSYKVGDRSESAE